MEKIAILNLRLFDELEVDYSLFFNVKNNSIAPFGLGDIKIKSSTIA
ncbi:MAG TPA: hypothetical protein P5335_05750 [Flavobacterium sp.]|nr:hypothetical protein [Flavobacterium sp.]HRZ74413.1 hypothetical protein [Flavobacterium sp.]